MASNSKYSVRLQTTTHTYDKPRYDYTVWLAMSNTASDDEVRQIWPRITISVERVYGDERCCKLHVKVDNAAM
jgi:hypothetical protein